MKLPANRDGKPYISYSQYSLWKEMKSFNFGIIGKLEYFASYFIGHRSPDIGWAQFGIDVEDYICNKVGADKFTDEELKTLNKVKPLGQFQNEIWLDLGGFFLLGYIDDQNEDGTHIIDYKTASKNSIKKYYAPDYNQLKSYALKHFKETGVIPKLEVVGIERNGNAMYGGREALTVGSEIWRIPIQTSAQELEELEKDIIKVAHEISEYYEIFLKMNVI